MLVYLIMSKKKMKENDQITFWGFGGWKGSDYGHKTVNLYREMKMETCKL